MNNLLYNAIDAERRKSKINQQQISKEVGKATVNNNFWSSIRSGVVSFVYVLKVCKVLDLDFVIINRRKTRGSTHSIFHVAMTEIDIESLYKCINIEKEDFGFGNDEVAELVGAPSSRGNVWKQIKNSKIKLKNVVTICNALGLEIVIWNPKTQISYLINHPKTKK